MKKAISAIVGALVILIALWLVLGKGEEGKTIKQAVEKKETLKAVEKPKVLQIPP